MSKTVHPFAFRLPILRNWKSRWFDTRNYRKLLKSDIFLREWLEKRTRGMFVESIELERGFSFLHIILKTSRPGLIIGRKGEGSENLKKEIIKKLQKTRVEIPKEFKLIIEEIHSPETYTKIVIQMVAENLEKRMPFRRVMKQVAEKIMANKEVQGMKIVLSGRLGGAEMSRREWLKKGKMPLQTLRADIDFSRGKAHLPYGDIGIKVWIYKGERFNKS